MPTSNPVPSTDPSDLLFNAERLDQFVNGETSTFTDRLGESRKTLAGLSEEFPDAGANATAAAGAASAAATAKTAAEAARDAAILARDASFALGPKYATEALGRAATGDGLTFLVQGSGDVAATEYRRVNSTTSTPIASYPSSAAVAAIAARTTGIENVTAGAAVWGVADATGNAAITVRDDGQVAAPNLTSETASIKELTIPGTNEVITGDDALGFALVLADEDGNIAFGVGADGTVYPGGGAAEDTSDAGWSTLSVGLDDSIVHIGDSYTAGQFTLKDKAYINQLSQLSPYRHQNYGGGGNDALDLQYRIINRVAINGITFESMKARYAFVTTLKNDQIYRTVDLTMYAENFRRLLDAVRGCGTEPVVTTEFWATAPEHAFLRRIADETGCAFVDCTSMDAEIGGLDVGPFHQGHPGMRTTGVFWLPMLEFIDRMPKPQRAIKIFRRRSTFAVTAIADLLYSDRVDRAKKWKEITVYHTPLANAENVEELDNLGSYSFTTQADEYQKLAAETAVAFTDYTLFEISLPGTAMSLDALEITLGMGVATPTVYVRDYLDIPTMLPATDHGSSPTDATYLAGWTKPRGTWRSLGAYAGTILIGQSDLRKSMYGEKLTFMVAGAFSLTRLQVRYRGREVKSDLRTVPQLAPFGAELIAQPLCGTAPQLAAWTVAGTPTTLIPMDVYNAPRKPGTLVQVDGVCTISATKMIGQTVTLPAETGRVRRFLLTVWARYFPKAFLDASLYPGIDPTQIVDRIANPAGATITPDTCDLRTLKAEVWNDVTYPAQGGAEFAGFAALQWRPVEFVIEVPAYRGGPTMSFRLSCPDGEIQVAKASWKEIA